MPSNNHRNDHSIRSLIGQQLMAFIQEHPDKPWDYHGIIYNPNITMEFIEAHPGKPWVWSAISRNPNITMEIIEKYPEIPWNWEGISSNNFSGLYDKIQERYSMRLLAFYARKQYWNNL
jgi:hypothetical protein